MYFIWFWPLPPSLFYIKMSHKWKLSSGNFFNLCARIKVIAPSPVAGAKNVALYLTQYDADVCGSIRARGIMPHQSINFCSNGLSVRARCASIFVWSNDVRMDSFCLLMRSCSLLLTDSSPQLLHIRNLILTFGQMDGVVHLIQRWYYQVKFKWICFIFLLKGNILHVLGKPGENIISYFHRVKTSHFGLTKWASCKNIFFLISIVKK